MDAEAKKFMRGMAREEGEEAIEDSISGFERIVRDLDECRKRYEAATTDKERIAALERAAQVGSSQLNSVGGFILRTAVKIAACTDDERVVF